MISAKSNVIHIAVVEDHPDYRRSLVNFLNTAKGYECVCDCGSADEAHAQIPRFKPDVTIVDLILREPLEGFKSPEARADTQARTAKDGRAGLECIRELRAKVPSCEILVLTQHEDPELIFQAMCAEASGYCLKRAEPIHLLEAVRTVYSGGSFLSPAIARTVVKFFAEAARPEKLTATEDQILDLLKTGKSIKEIATKLGRSEETVRTHNKRILAKLHAGSREELLRRFGIPTSKLR